MDITSDVFKDFVFKAKAKDLGPRPRHTVVLFFAVYRLQFAKFGTHICE